MGTGGVARLLKTHGGQWQVFAMGGDGSSECIRVEAVPYICPLVHFSAST